MNIVNAVKKPALIKLGFIICATSFTSQTQCTNAEKAFLGGCAVVATVAIGTAIYYKLNPSIETIKTQSFENLQKAIAYDSTIQRLNMRFDINHMTPLEQRRAADSVDEYLLNDLFDLTNFRFSHETYLPKINSLIQDLKYYQEKIENKLSSRKPIDQSDEATLKELLFRTKKSVKELSFLNLYVSSHISYFNLKKLYLELFTKFSPELGVLEKFSNNLDVMNPYLVDKIKNLIRAKDDSTTYPFTKFLNLINESLGELNKSINKLAYAYPGLNYYANQLKSNLVFIKNCAAGSIEYLNEKQMQENAQREKEKLALKEREVKAKELEALAKQQEAEAKQREAEVKERELALKEKELREKQLQAIQAANQPMG